MDAEVGFEPTKLLFQRQVTLPIRLLGNTLICVELRSPFQATQNPKLFTNWLSQQDLNLQPRG
jgi:hypothetical protein